MSLITVSSENLSSTCVVAGLVTGTAFTYFYVRYAPCGSIFNRGNRGQKRYDDGNVSGDTLAILGPLIGIIFSIPLYDAIAKVSWVKITN